MAEALPYLTPQWRDEAMTRLTDELSPERMNHISSSMANIHKNCPDGKDRFLYIRYEEGRLTGCEVGEGDPPEAEFKILGDYDVFVKVNRCEMKSQVALMTGKLKLKGNMVKALKLASIVDRFNKVLSQIPTSF